MKIRTKHVAAIAVIAACSYYGVSTAIADGDNTFRADGYEMACPSLTQVVTSSLPGQFTLKDSSGLNAIKAATEDTTFNANGVVVTVDLQTIKKAHYDKTTEPATYGQVDCVYSLQGNIVGIQLVESGGMGNYSVMNVGGNGLKNQDSERYWHEIPSSSALNYYQCTTTADRLPQTGNAGGTGIMFNNDACVWHK